MLALVIDSSAALIERCASDRQTPPSSDYVGFRRDAVELHMQFQFEYEMGTIRLRFLVEDPDTSKIPLGDVSGRIDHLAIDLARRRLFVAELGNDTVPRDARVVAP